MLACPPESPHTPLPIAGTLAPSFIALTSTPCQPPASELNAALQTPRSEPVDHSCSPESVGDPDSPDSGHRHALTIDTDSGKSSYSPALLDCSYDSGIGEGHDPQLQQRIQQCKHILMTLERDKERYRKLRERLSKIVDRKSKTRSNDETHSCNICCTPIDASDTKTFVQCSTCNKNICRGVKCADWLPKTAQWECHLCHSSKDSMAQTSSWVAEQMSFNQQKFVYPLRARSEVYIPINDSNDSSMPFESASQVGMNSTAISTEQKLKIREYVEELVSNMLGGTLDNITVGKLSKSENYLPAILNGRSASQPPSQTNNTAEHTEGLSNGNSDEQQDFSNISQARLRQLIETIIAEMAHAPSTSGAVSEVTLDTRSNSVNDLAPLTNGDVTRRHRTEHYFEPQIYQDLLATAVLNKIADKQSHNSRRLSESTPDLIGRDLKPIYHEENHSTSSGSSVEPRSDCSYTDNEQIPNIGKGENDLSPCGSQRSLHVIDRPLRITPGRESQLSDYIATHMVPLPDLSAPVTESEEEDYLSVTSSTVGEGTWENNWLFKKKRSADIKSSVTANSVGMLVPAPKEDVRAQIGDKTADEVGDLSEMGSDTDDSSLDMLRNNDLDPLNDRLLSKQLIGGQNTKLLLDELIESASMISHTSLADNEPIYTETKNKDVLNANAKTEAINTTVAQSPAKLMHHEEQIKPNTIIPKSNNETIEVTPPNPLAEQTIIETETTKDQPEAQLIETNNNANAFTTLTNNTNTTNNENNNIIDNNDNNINNNDTNNLSHKINKQLTNELDIKVESIDKTEDDNNDEAPDDILLRRFVPGSIAEREYKKWYNAVEMPNNPYAPEALKKRISGSRESFMDLPNISPSHEANPIDLISNANNGNATDAEKDRTNEVKRYSRDYYINEANRNGTENVPSQRQPSPDIKNPKMTNGIGKYENSDEPSTEHMVINEQTNQTSLIHSESNQKTETAEVASSAIETAQPQPKLAKVEVLYQAKPIVVLDEHAPSSIEESHTNLSLNSNHSLTSLRSVRSVRSPHTSSSDDSDIVRVYDFKKQETIKIRDWSKRPAATPPPPLRNKAVSMEAMEQQVTRKERPRELIQRTASADGLLRAGASVKPTRGSTPTALRFLQPKRKLIEPSQVLCNDEVDEKTTSNDAHEKTVIEEEVAQSLPSVKALAKAFLQQSNEDVKETISWRTKTKLTPETLKHFTPIVPHRNYDISPVSTAVVVPKENSKSIFNLTQEIISNNNINHNQNSNENKEADTTNTIASTASSSSLLSPSTPTTPTCEIVIPSGKMSPIPMLPSGFLKSNIAFFENLKSK